MQVLHLHMLLSGLRLSVIVIDCQIAHSHSDLKRIQVYLPPPRIAVWSNFKFILWLAIWINHEVPVSIRTTTLLSYYLIVLGTKATSISYVNLLQTTLSLLWILATDSELRETKTLPNSSRKLHLSRWEDCTPSPLDSEQLRRHFHTLHSTTYCTSIIIYCTSN